MEPSNGAASQTGLADFPEEFPEFSGAGAWHDDHDKGPLRSPIRNVHGKDLLTAAEIAEVQHRPVHAGQARKALDEATSPRLLECPTIGLERMEPRWAVVPWLNLPEYRPEPLRLFRAENSPPCCLLAAPHASSSGRSGRRSSGQQPTIVSFDPHRCRPADAHAYPSAGPPRAFQSRIRSPASPDA